MNGRTSRECSNREGTSRSAPRAAPRQVHELRLVQGTRPRRSLMAVVTLLVVVALASVVTSMVLNTRNGADLL